MSRQGQRQAIDLVREARARGVELWPGDRPGTIRYRAPVGSLDAQLRKRLAQAKADVTGILTESRVDLDEAVAMLCRVHADVARNYTVGAIPWAKGDSELSERLQETEDRLGELAGTPNGPLLMEWTAAVEALRRLLSEIVQRYRARRVGCR